MHNPGHVVRLYRDAAEQHGRDLFACSVETWTFLLELGHTFGWRPHGTTYELPSKSKIETAARRNYEPGAVADRKLIAADDAIAWARALELALNSPHLTAIIQARAKDPSADGSDAQAISNSIAEFAQYAYGGAFTFAREQGADSAKV